MKLRLLGMACAPALLIAAAALPAGAANLVTNGSFEASTGKTTFQNHVPGWTGGANLTFLDAPGTADDGSYLSVYSGFPNHSPDGGNFVEADGDPSYSGAISQAINGLIAGQSYKVTFYQAAGQQAGFTGPTTEQWAVSLGGDTQTSSTFSLAQAATGDWQKQTMTFKATGASEVLSFLAQGTPNGAPPISFLDGVSLTAAVPEPATWSLMIVGLGLMGGALRRRRTMSVATL
jgi:hypothetical protein